MEQLPRQAGFAILRVNTMGKRSLFPIHHAIWKVGASPGPLSGSKLASKKELEDMITSRPEILSAGWMLIGT